MDGEKLYLDDNVLTPPEIVRELDRYVIAQDDAKRAVAVALRNRWRRLRVPENFRDEITPKNILMMGPTGVGKTEISRRLAKLARAPFVKVEASKFTEIGYVGRDVDSIIRDLTEVSFKLVRDEESERVHEKAERLTEEKLLDLLQHGSSGNVGSIAIEVQPLLVDAGMAPQMPAEGDGSVPVEPEGAAPTREGLCQMLRAGELDARVVEVEVSRQVTAHMQVLGPQGGMGEIEGQLKDMFTNLIPKQKDLRKLTVKEARQVLIEECEEDLIDQDEVAAVAVRRAEQTGIVFIDEIDKICCTDGARSHGPDVSREGVQRDLLPLVEGSTVSTKYGPVRTDHILFIASGAFHVSKPSDLMPEFQGRFPIRVELKSLSPSDFVRILTEPENALTRQYRELLKTEGVELEFTPDAIEEIARLTAEVNSKTENIGARRLHTLLEKLLEDLSFRAHESSGTQVKIDRTYVRGKLSGIVEDTDLSRFIL